MKFRHVVIFVKRVQKIIDNMSSKYDYIYFMRNKKIFLSFIAFIVCIVIPFCFQKGCYGVFNKIFSAFIDVTIVFIFIFVTLFIKYFFDDEKIRIIETNENLKIDKIIPLSADANSVEVVFDKEDYYEMPSIIWNLIKWVNFDKNDFFRNNFGPLDISKICLRSVVLKNKKIILYCNQSSFYNIAYTHYFPDYKISDGKMLDNKTEITLRNMLDFTLTKFYNDIKLNNYNEIHFSSLLPNPIGITGIVIISFEKKKYYLLQLRNFDNAAARKKLQWSFAGTIDVLPDFYKKNFKFIEMIYSEFKEEVISKFAILDKVRGDNIKYKILGIALNKLYLYQPEFFVSVNINISDTEYDEIKIFLENNLSSIEKINKVENFIIVSDLNKIKSIIARHNLKCRNLFYVGYKLLSINNKYL